MGDLNSEIIELKSLNLFIHAIKGLTDIDDQPCFNSINYQDSLFPVFHISIIENNIEKEKKVTPDVLLWNINKKIVIILEIKGGNSVEETDINQIRKYLEIPIDQIQERIRNILEDPTFELERFYVGIVHYERTILSCLKSQNCIKRLNSLKDNFLILKQSPGESLKIWNPDFITFDHDLLNLLNNGIEIPLNPRNTIYLSENPSVEGTMWAIINYIHDKFYEGYEINEIQIDPIQLRNEFRYSLVSLNRIKNALNYLIQIGYCIEDRNNFIFKFENFDNPEVIKKKIMQIDTKKPALITKKLNKFIE